MNLFIILSGIVVGLLVLILLAALVSRPDYLIEREIIIDRPKQQVFDYLKLLKNQDHYSKWVMMDPQARMEYRGTDGTVGFVAAWDSDHKQVGKGEQEIIRLSEGEGIDLEVRFERPFKGKAFSTLATEAVSDRQTRVTWTFKGMRNYGMKVAHIVFNLKKVLGKDLAISLGRLKTALEKNETARAEV